MSTSKPTHAHTRPHTATDKHLAKHLQSCFLCCHTFLAGNVLSHTVALLIRLQFSSRRFSDLHFQLQFLQTFGLRRTRQPSCHRAPDCQTNETGPQSDTLPQASSFCLGGLVAWSLGGLPSTKARASNPQKPPIQTTNSRGS